MPVRPFNHLPPPSSNARERRVLEAVHGLHRGKIECVVEVTLTAGAATTTITDHRISMQTALLLDPLTASAAAELGAGTVYCLAANRSKGKAILTHANSAVADRTFRVCLLG